MRYHRFYSHHSVASVCFSMSQVLKQQLLLTTRYNKWASAQIGAFCNRHFKNNPEFYTQDIGIPFGSIRNTLCHIWFAEQLWYCRMVGGTHRNLTLPHTVPRTINMHEFPTYWQDNHENQGKFQTFFDGIDNELLFHALSKSADNWCELVQVQTDDHELCEEFKYFDTKCQKYMDNKNIIITHVINHSTHHRGQISGAVTKLCSTKPIELDLVAWLRIKQQNNSSTLQ